MSITKTALIVDDSRSACVVLSRMLARYGVKADFAYSGQEALEFLASKQPQVIFMDHSMPDMDGLQVIERIRKNPALSNIPILMFTARSGADYLAQVQEAGAVDVIPKILDSNVLETALTKIHLIGHDHEHEHHEEPSAEEKMRVWLESVIENKIAPALTFRIDDATRELREETLQQSQKIFRDSIRFHTKQHNRLIESAEAHSDYLVTAYQENKAQLSRRMSALLGLFLVLGAAMIWQIWETRVQWSQQWEQQVALNNDWRDKISEAGQQQVAMVATPQTAEQAVTLVVQAIDADGRAVGSLLGIGSSGQWMNLVAETDYLFQINNQGWLREFDGKRYYQTSDCFGVSLVEAHSGLLFRGVNDEVLYTPMREQPSLSQPYSMMGSDGRCEVYKGKPLSLVQLLPNNASITGINSVVFSLERQPYTTAEAY